MAQHLVHSRFAWPEAFFMPPFYPYLLAVVSLVSPSTILIQLLQAIAASAAAVLVYLSARRIFNPRVALASYLGYLACGNLLFLDLVFLPHVWTVVGELLVCYLLLLLGERPRHTRRLAVAVGVILGLLILARAELLLMLPLLLGLALIARRTLSLKNCVWVLLGSGLAIAPVTIHNLMAERDFILVSYNGGLNLFIGNNPHADGTWQPSYPLVQTGSVTIATLKRNSRHSLEDGALLRPAASSAYWTRKALSFIASNPGRFLSLTLRRLRLFISNYEVPNNYYYDLARRHSLLLKLLFLPFGIVLALGFAGLILARDTWRRSYGCYLFCAVYLVTNALIFTLGRLRAPAQALLVIFAAYYLTELWTGLAARRPHLPDARLRPTLKLLPAVLLLVVLSLFPVANQRAYALEGQIQAGNIYLELGRPAQAQVEYAHAYALDRTSTIAIYGLFNAATKLKNRSEAERYVRELRTLAQTPADSVYACLSQAKLGTMTGDFLSARTNYQQAVRLDPANTDTRFLLASVHLTLADTVAAAQQLDTLLTLDPEDQQALRLYRLLSTGSRR